MSELQSGPGVLIVRELGLQPYETIWHAMQAFTSERGETDTDEIWMLEHPPVFTQGQAGKPEHVLFPGDIPVVQVDRGGQVTYHGPGQLVVYPLINLTRLGLGARSLVTLIETSLVNLLADFDIEAYPRADAPGVYVDERKIASIGLRIRRHCSYHGLALNVTVDLEPFRRINPCGYAGLEMVRLADLADAPDLPELGRRWLGHFTSGLGYGEIHYTKEQRMLQGSGTI